MDGRGKERCHDWRCRRHLRRLEVIEKLKLKPYNSWQKFGAGGRVGSTRHSIAIFEMIDNMGLTEVSTCIDIPYRLTLID